MMLDYAFRIQSAPVYQEMEPAIQRKRAKGRLIDYLL